MKMIFMIMIMMSTTMMALKHPLSMGFNLILITFMSSITMSIWMKYSWYSYILILVMLGGMLVLFMYMASIASNEIMKFSFKTLVMMMISIVVTMILLKEEMLSYNSIMIQTMDGQQNMSMMKLFNTQSSYITIMMALYLLMTMIYVIFITNTFEGPMRKKN
uniref:NADH dehydrogenase subunit 6 n=1 Tax=Halobates germanus TaxID=109006 RepID=UPI002E799A2A|nr:NADH dehydrogenase subunit 6 [Halobates germanus]WPW46642.1 NADH dehydrogenase subunit 6 [Halobates germanus]WPW46655.1 NADH dehydrogenase subunit 6 [Halobates germanus]WPW46759.1 NADH dehydrogenase subunit 6 [Halobates germanus]WPW46772.1 NADH dehydrogenase subunit 6 [Halobates germanus]